MKHVVNPLFLTLEILGTLIWGQCLLNQTLLYLLLGTMAIIGLISMLIRPILSFSILMSFILIVGFINIALAWNLHLDIHGQGFDIENQVILTTGAILAWLSGYSIFNHNLELHELRSEVRTLRKVDEQTGILTFSEFLSRAQLLVTGLLRRNEEGFLVKIELLEEAADYKNRILYETLSKIVLESLRTEYDLVSQLSHTSLLVLLNNTDVTGVDIVLDRLHKKVENEPKLLMSSLNIQKYPVKEKWETTYSLINTWHTGGEL